jgi:4'-phosphopantetheinyl transferase
MGYRAAKCKAEIQSAILRDRIVCPRRAGTLVMLKIETRVLRNMGRVPCVPRLQQGSVHIWYQTMTSDPLAADDFVDLLSESERLRARHYRFVRHRNEFILCRCTLRLLLAGYLRSSPERVSFSVAEHGKPRLHPSLKSDDLLFNISHSDGVAIFAFATGAELGVDIERVRPAIEHIQLAEQFFSKYERAHLNQLSGKKLSDAFFRCWTRKEAYVKARGVGLSIPLQDFDVSVIPGEPAALLATRPDAGEARRWSLHDLWAPPGYAAALAVCTYSA